MLEGGFGEELSFVGWHCLDCNPPVHASQGETPEPCQIEHFFHFWPLDFGIGLC